jgi:hypothetical protein
MDNVVTAGASQAMALPRGTGSDEVHRPDDDLGGIGAGGAGSRLGRMLVCPSMSAGKPKLDMGLTSLVDVGVTVFLPPSREPPSRAGQRIGWRGFSKLAKALEQVP